MHTILEYQLSRARVCSVVMTRQVQQQIGAVSGGCSNAHAHNLHLRVLKR